jgi:hypothetical protein
MRINRPLRPGQSTAPVDCDVIDNAMRPRLTTNLVYSWLKRTSRENTVSEKFREGSVNSENWLQRVLLPHWAGDRSPDADHPHRRRFTARYRRKKCIVKNVWICSGLLMLWQATPAVILTLGLGTTFLSFLILDETR